MRYDKAVVLTDLDGTFFDSRGKISEPDKDAVKTFISEGGYFGLATGREPHNALQYLSDVPLNAPSIVLNGAAVFDFADGVYVDQIPVDREAAADAARYCLDNRLPIDLQIYTDGGIFYATPLETADPGFLRIHQPTEFLALDHLLTKIWFKILLLERKEDALLPVHAYLQEKGYGSRLEVVEGTTDVVQVGKYQELLPKGINKGSAIPRLRVLPQYAGRSIFAVGDYWNDYEMLRAVDVPCAPDNAIGEIKSICRHILPSHNDSPIAYLIREVIPNL